MFRNTRLPPWPAVIDEAEQAEPVLSRWAAARVGTKAKWWVSSPQRLSRYLDNIFTAHVLSARNDFRS